ncbi:MAG TPA: YraN family protein [Patescibacteria group bacterium]|nr:YraN family protein [Patescibacteria group bacterium]
MKIVNVTGVLGEDLACDYLKKKGYKILERNFRKKYQEIDVIALHNKTLVFVEVKTRKSTAFGTPFESIAPWKLKNLIQLAQFYKMLNPKLPENMRIDAIGVSLNGEKVEKIEHLENIMDIDFT